jgi:NTP pyrophosphatase (non-canonical NTP hydrolase)
MNDIKTLTKKINKFVNDRDWEKFQTPKDLAISVTLEASEVLEHFQWKNDKEFQKYIKTHKEDLADEIADVATYLFKLADKLDIDLPTALVNKLDKSAKKYPINKIKGDKRLENYYELKKQARQKSK